MQCQRFLPAAKGFEIKMERQSPVEQITIAGNFMLLEDITEVGKI